MTRMIEDSKDIKKYEYGAGDFKCKQLHLKLLFYFKHVFPKLECFIRNVSRSQLVLNTES